METITSYLVNWRLSTSRVAVPDLVIAVLLVVLAVLVGIEPVELGVMELIAPAQAWAIKPVPVLVLV